MSSAIIEVMESKRERRRDKQREVGWREDWVDRKRERDTRRIEREKENDEREAEVERERETASAYETERIGRMNDDQNNSIGFRR